MFEATEKLTLREDMVNEDAVDVVDVEGGDVRFNAMVVVKL